MCIHTCLYWYLIHDAISLDVITSKMPTNIHPYILACTQHVYQHAQIPKHAYTVCVMYMGLLYHIDFCLCSGEAGFEDKSIQGIWFCSLWRVRCPTAMSVSATSHRQQMVWCQHTKLKGGSLSFPWNRVRLLLTNLSIRISNYMMQSVSCFYVSELLFKHFIIMY